MLSEFFLLTNIHNQLNFMPARPSLSLIGNYVSKEISLPGPRASFSPPPHEGDPSSSQLSRAHTHTPVRSYIRRPGKVELGPVSTRAPWHSDVCGDALPPPPPLLSVAFKTTAVRVVVGSPRSGGVWLGWLVGR